MVKKIVNFIRKEKGKKKKKEGNLQPNNVKRIKHGHHVIGKFWLCIGSRYLFANQIVI